MLRCAAGHVIDATKPISYDEALFIANSDGSFSIYDMDNAASLGYSSTLKYLFVSSKDVIRKHFLWAAIVSDDISGIEDNMEEKSDSI